jgi:pyridoxal phosphate enzyme (YggS family)
LRIQAALRAVGERIAEAALKSGRSPSHITLVAVSKAFPLQAILDAYAAGQRDFGENRVDEALDKIAAAWPADIRWHLIGHVQSRKARSAAGRFHLIHSVDSLKLAAKLSAACTVNGADAAQDILLECNVSGEAAKEGFPVAGWEREPATLDAFVRDAAQIAALPGLRVRGLMTMAPIVEHPDQARPHFASLRGLREVLRQQVPQGDWDQLSMGMSDDFEAAIAEGATLVRIGRAIFGAR